MRVTFNEVAIKATKRWKEDGKVRTKTRKFYQTLNPFNQNADGTVKTRDQIMAEITAERDAWLAV